jgi:hypothetical protein
MLTITGKALGRKRPLFAEFSVPPPPAIAEGDRVTLRDFIDSVVRHEIAAFRERQHQRQFVRALTARQIDEGVEAGKIESGGSEIEPQPVDEEEAVATALQAFDDGMYLVVIDGEDHRELDAQVYLQPDSQVTFVRLTLLAGG